MLFEFKITPWITESGFKKLVPGWDKFYLEQYDKKDKNIHIKR